VLNVIRRYTLRKMLQVKLVYVIIVEKKEDLKNVSYADNYIVIMSFVKTIIYNKLKLYINILHLTFHV